MKRQILAVQRRISSENIKHLIFFLDTHTSSSHVRGPMSASIIALFLCPSWLRFLCDDLCLLLCCSIVYLSSCSPIWICHQSGLEFLLPGLDLLFASVVPLNSTALLSSWWHEVASCAASTVPQASLLHLGFWSQTRLYLYLFFYAS